MRFVFALLALALLEARPLAAEVEVRVANGRVDIRAKAAPLAELLDRLARLTGMKVVYEGAPPRQPLTLTLEGYTPAEAVLSLLDGLGLNYALLMDRTGTQVEQLLMSGSAPASTSSTSPPRPAAPAAPPPAEPEDIDDEPPEDVPQGAVPGAPEEGPAKPARPGAEAPFYPMVPFPSPSIAPLTFPSPPPREEPAPAPSPSPRPPQ